MGPASRRRRTDRSRPRTGGYTLVEVVVALLISAIMVTSVFSVAITAKQSGGKSDRHLIATQTSRLVTSTLRNFVTGCACDFSTGACATTGVGACTISGPMPGACSLGGSVPTCTSSWSFNNGGTGVADALGNVYALKLTPGCATTGGAPCHVISGLLPAWFSAAPYSATVSYNVSNPNGYAPGGRPVPKVSVYVNWTEP